MGVLFSASRRPRAECSDEFPCRCSSSAKWHFAKVDDSLYRHYRGAGHLACVIAFYFQDLVRAQFVDVDDFDLQRLLRRFCGGTDQLDIMPQVNLLLAA